MNEITPTQSANQAAYQNLNRESHALTSLASRELSHVDPDDEDWVKVDIIGRGVTGLALSVYSSPQDHFVIKIPLKEAYNLSFSHELSILEKCKDCPYVVRLFPGIPLPRASGGYDYSITMENAGPNIHQVYLAGKNRMSYPHLRLFAWQMLATLAQWEEMRLVHGDLKPANISYRPVRPVKTTIYDFGLAYLQSIGGKAELGSPGYSAPECHLKIAQKTSRSDIWSLACILYELLTGAPLFEYKVSGDNFEEAFFKLVESTLGERLPAHMIPENNERAQEFFRREQRPADFSGYFYSTICQCHPKGINPKLFIDLLQSMLQWDPEKRISPEKAMQQPFFSDTMAAH